MKEGTVVLVIILFMIFFISSNGLKKILKMEDNKVFLATSFIFSQMLYMMSSSYIMARVDIGVEKAEKLVIFWVTSAIFFFFNLYQVKKEVARKAGMKRMTQDGYGFMHNIARNRLRRRLK